MEMTYAALAKSLGISLKPSSPPTPTTASAPSSALTTNSTSLQISKSNTQTPEDATVAIETDDAQRIDEQDERQVEVETQKDETPSEEIQQPQPPLEATGNKSQVKPEAENKAEVQDDLQEGLGWEDAEGDTDSDIASSRPASPESPIVQTSSQIENENAESHIIITGSNSPSEGTDMDMDVDAKSQPEDPPNPTPIDTASTPQAPARSTKKLTEEQLHHAKVLVLDLLGWGVPPSYLLQRGISHALLYTVFTDLRLRLPEDIIADCVRLVSAQS